VQYSWSFQRQSRLIFRNNEVDFLLCFAEPFGFTSSYQAKLCGALRAIEVAHQMNGSNLWLESDSALVVQSFKNPDFLGTWSLRNRWNNALFLLRQINFVVSHIFREGDHVADNLASYGLNLSSMYWHSLPLFIVDRFEKNKLGLANYRIFHS
jgi:ribonuclease HI